MPDEMFDRIQQTEDLVEKCSHKSGMKSTIIKGRDAEAVDQVPLPQECSYFT